MQSSVTGRQSPVGSRQSSDTRRQSLARWLALATFLAVVPLAAQRAAPPRAAISDRPDTPFKLATFEAAGKVRIGLVLRERVLDLAAANDALTTSAGLTAVRMPTEMRALIEAYDRVKPRLYQIANHFSSAVGESGSFAFDLASISLKAPIKYPYNVLAIAANYKL